MKTIALGDRGLPARIAGEIGRRITLGELKVGEILPKETELLSGLQVSRTTLREALKILSTKGFIEAKPRLGTRVRSPEFWNTLDPVVLAWQGDADDQEALAEELFEIRLAVEPLAAKLAARRGSTTEHGLIRAAFARMAADHETAAAAIEADISFHLQIFQAAHNRFLLPVSSVIRAALTISIPKTLKSFGGLQQSLKMHEAIIDAIELRNEKAAAEAAEILIGATYRRNFTHTSQSAPE
ncbi:FadR family transcriptional regulator [Rhizobium sp. KVB221]|uniref:FadR family transcriptional regulator n=1 Tax=Rhizobium setariae TaxID=2801340 RepID=A0A936YRK1_9HYPH|nr:FadR/GntR family transcriptional regulator [Rhizobium setariae]MBL0371476.1 FadR family transcriptional regulator [Rhizobium setariae]